ncbi:MAG: hypothetical protein ACYCST_18085 [Acidimicrobiales bacterium]
MTPPANDRLFSIEHVVVVMLEDRSFEHCSASSTPQAGTARLLA